MASPSPVPPVVRAVSVVSRESRADCGEQFGVASWTPQGEFEFGGQEAKGVRSSWPASLTN